MSTGTPISQVHLGGYNTNEPPEDSQDGLPLVGVPVTVNPDTGDTTPHTQPLSSLTQSGATTNEVPQWNGTEWVPASIAGVGSTAWGTITGTLADQTDLQTALNGKAPTAHTHSLTSILQSGANVGQVPQWTGSAWVPADVSAGATVWGAIIGTLSDQTDLQAELNSKAPTIHTHQVSDLLESGANVGDTLIWSGSEWLPSPGPGVAWGSISGTLSNQTDLQTALNGKAALSHTHALSSLTQSGATPGQVAQWNGSAWVPATVSGGGGSAPTLTLVTGTSQVAVAGNHYVLLNVAATTVSLPVTPADGDILWVTWTNNLTTNSIDRSGKSIEGKAENLLLNYSRGTLQLRYVATINDWRIL